MPTPKLLISPGFKSLATTKSFMIVDSFSFLLEKSCFKPDLGVYNVEPDILFGFKALLTILTSNLHRPILNFPMFLTRPKNIIDSLISTLLWVTLISFAFFVYLSRTNIENRERVLITRNDEKTIDQNIFGLVSFFEIITSSRKIRKNIINVIQ